VAGIRTFALLHNSLAVWGLRGVDRFMCFVMAQTLQAFVKVYRKEARLPPLPAPRAC
jgi:hypothetical protein